MTGKGRGIKCICLLAGALLLSGCGEKQAVITETVIESVESSLSDDRGITLYYVSGSTIAAAEERLRPKQPDSVTGCLEEVMNAMKLTEGFAFDGYTVGVENAVTLYFSIGEEVSRETALLEKASVVSTVSQIRNIGAITISSSLPGDIIEEEELQSGSFYYYDAVVPTGQNNGRITLYLPKEEGEGLEPVQLAVQLQLDVSVEEEVVRQLIQRNVFPEGTKLLSVSVAQKVAYVDLTPEFEKDCTAQQVASLVDSVSALPHIGSIQILIDGEKKESIGGVDTHVPLRFFDPAEVEKPAADGGA
ncbi:MAG: GerMN domain-containing protein [Eubacterium sp.]|nr:GerMN domain-containing protein [Eubacterium sp.]